MSVYFYVGNLGGGKTLSAVDEIRTYLSQGRRVATNLDLYLDEMFFPRKNTDVMRIPDKPRLEDLEIIGTGDNRPVSEYVEDDFGLLVLDELSSWMNSRAWQDRERRALLEWFIHARKLHWDVIFIVQDLSVIDAQLRDIMCEYRVTNRSMAKVPIPIIGRFGKLFKRNNKPWFLPKFHIRATFLGGSKTAYRLYTNVFRGTDLYTSYSTGQIFSLDSVLLDNGDELDMRSTYCYLSPWHLKGRYLPVMSLKYRLQVLSRWVATVFSAMFHSMATIATAGSSNDMAIVDRGRVSLPAPDSLQMINGNLLSDDF